MQFNDTSGKNGLIQECEFNLGLGDAGISGDATLLKVFTRLINTTYQEIITMILASLDGWEYDDSNLSASGFIKTFDLTANQQYFAMAAADKVLKVRRVEVNYGDGVWRVATPISIDQIGTPAGTQTDVSLSFSKTEPAYSQVGLQVFLYPYPDTNVTGGAKVWTTREVDEFTTADTTQEPGIDEPFHRLISIGASRKYAGAKGMDVIKFLNDEWVAGEARLKQYYGAKQQDRHAALQPAYEDFN